MFIVYILYSMSSSKTYVGFTSDVERRLFEHNVSETKGFTLRYRPWILIRKEIFADKTDAMTREKFLKTGRGREEIKAYVDEFLNGAVSAAAEKD
jgi:putative endonuclease